MKKKLILLLSLCTGMSIFASAEFFEGLALSALDGMVTEFTAQMEQNMKQSSASFWKKTLVSYTAKYAGYRFMSSVALSRAVSKEKNKIKKQLRSGVENLDVTLLDGQRLVYKDGFKVMGPFLFSPDEIEG